MSSQGGFRPAMLTPVQEQGEVAVLLLKAGHKRKAERLAWRNVEDNPLEGDAWVVYGTVLLGQKKYRKVIARFEALTIGCFRQTPALSYILAKAHAGLGEKRQAARFARKAAAHPRFWQAIAHDPDLAGYVVEGKPATIRFGRLD